MSCGNHHNTPCREVMSALFIYLDNELDDQVKQSAISLHLEECPPCFQEFGYERHVRSILASACQEQAPIELHTRITHAISTEFRLSITEIEFPNQ